MPSRVRDWRTSWKNSSTASSSFRAVSRRRMSRRCSSPSTTCRVSKERSSRFFPRVPDRVRRSRASRVSVSSWVMRARDWSNWATLSPISLT